MKLADPTRSAAISMPPIAIVHDGSDVSIAQRSG
jgi:hypothetical protein